MSAQVPTIDESCPNLTSSRSETTKQELSFAKTVRASIAFMQRFGAITRLKGVGLRTPYWLSGPLSPTP